LGDLMLAPFTPLFGSLFFAQAAQLTLPSLRPALRHQLVWACVGVLGIGLTVGLGGWLLPLLNRADFAAALPYYQIQAVGDALRMLSFPISIALLATGQWRKVAGLEALSLLVYLVATYVAIKALGTEGLAWAHSIRYLVFALATAWSARSLLFVSK
jgi:O-antigen/teichoic acid export membrane protein